MATVRNDMIITGAMYFRDYTNTGDVIILYRDEVEVGYLRVIDVVWDGGGVGYHTLRDGAKMYDSYQEVLAAV